MLKLDLDEQQKNLLLKTMEAYTDAFNISAEWGYYNRSTNKVLNHRGTYRYIRDNVPGLYASLVQSARDCACEALRGVKNSYIPKRKKYAAMRYKKKEMKICIEESCAYLATIAGRIRAPFKLYDNYYKYSGWTIYSSVVSYRKAQKQFYLGIVYEKKEDVSKSNGRVLGIDRGLKNVVVCSNNKFYNSNKINAVRGKYAHMRAELQARDTRSAKRKLKKIAGREKRFTANENHRISKQIANTSFSVFALEDLKNIRWTSKTGKNLKKKLHLWSYAQFQNYLSYKAEELGKIVLEINPWMTSQTCSKCGDMVNTIRQGPSFFCNSCGFSLNADLNASRNIAQAGMSALSRLSTIQPNVTDCDVRLGNDSDNTEPSHKFHEHSSETRSNETDCFTEKPIMKQMALVGSDIRRLTHHHYQEGGMETRS